MQPPSPSMCRKLRQKKSKNRVVRIDRRGMEGWGCPEPHPPMLMAAASALTRFTPSGRSGPHPSKPRRECIKRGTRNAEFGTRNEKTTDTLSGISRSAFPVPHSALLLCLATGEDTGHEVQDVRCARFVIAVIPNQATLDDIDFFLRCLVHHVGDDGAELDRVFLVLE